MENFVILCDATCDLTNELREQYGIEWVGGTFTYPDGKEERALKSWSDCKNIPDCTREAFYALLKKNPNEFKTAPASVQEYFECFESFVKEGKALIVFPLSAALSGTYNFMCSAKKMADEKYPNAKIYVVDTQRFTCGYGLMAIHASMLREQGKSFEEVVKYCEENRNKFHQTGWLDDLSFVAKKGRMTNAKAFFGNLIGIKPIGEFDPNGLTTVIAKFKGEKAAFKACLEYMAEVGENIGDQIVLIAQSNRLKQAETFKQMIEERFSPKAVYICDVMPSNGINVGPGLMAAYYVGKPISEGLNEEKALYAKIAQNI